ncbi:MAG: hypothetical protein Q7R89_01295 [bacterium]|nr:hypothetical protein [bacterium]
MPKPNRISFSVFDAMHLYDLAYEQFQISKKDGICVLCVALKKQLEKIVGRKEVKDIQRRAKEHPYRK